MELGIPRSRPFCNHFDIRCLQTLVIFYIQSVLTATATPFFARCRVNFTRKLLRSSCEYFISFKSDIFQNTRNELRERISTNHYNIKSRVRLHFQFLKIMVSNSQSDFDEIAFFYGFYVIFRQFFSLMFINYNIPIIQLLIIRN